MEHIVQTTLGKVRGYERDGMVEYLGIPYAQPPVGPLRFRRSVLHDAWTDVYDAAAYGPAPIQLMEGKVIGDEDCLTVNVQRPAADPADGGKLPVAVYIYGGGYNTGHAGDEMYRGEAFAKDGLLFFSFNYRTNVLGFYDFTTYPGCEDFDSNCGLSDQILALNWIRANVEAFGGDPERITIFGESAGGASVVNMLACPGVKGTFSQAIVQSGLPNCMMTHQTARENVDLFLEGMHWTEKDLPRLRTEDPRLFLVGNEYVGARHQYKNPGMFLPGPIQDDLMPIRPIDAIRSGSADGIRLVIGTTLHEGTMFVHPENTGFPNSWTMIAEMLEKNGHADAMASFASYYEATGDPFIRFATEYAFEVPAVKVACAQKQYTDNVWMYRYELVTRSGEATGWRASHAFELPSVFVKRDHPFAHFVFDGEPAELFEEISGQMHGDWVRFMKEGQPGEDWPRFAGYNSPVRIYDRVTRTGQVDRTALMELWGDRRFYEN